MPGDNTVIGAALALIAKTTGSNRVMVMRADRPSHQALLTIESEWCNNLPSIKHEWQGQLANGTYGKMLRATRAAGFQFMITAEMPSNSILREAYKKAGVVGSKIYSLGHQEQFEYRYLSVEFCTFPPVTDPRLDDLVQLIRLQVSRGAR